MTSCIGKSNSEDDLTGDVRGDVKRPISPGKNGTTWTGAGGHKTDEDDGFDENYFRRRPKSFYFEGRRFGGDPGLRTHIADENYLRSMTMVYPPRGPPSGPYPHPYHGYSPAVTRQEMFLSQDTLLSLQNTQPNTPDLLLHRKAVSFNQNSKSVQLPTTQWRDLLKNVVYGS